jgi:arylsulfatase A-like enzyme
VASSIPADLGRTRWERSLVAFATIAVMVWSNVQPTMARSSTPRVVPRPNILIILTDDQRATGTVTERVMPNVLSWLGAGGRRFGNFFATTPLCCPDRSVLMSGRYAHNTGVRTNADTGSLDHTSTMQRLLQGTGYRTAFVGKFFNGWDTSAPPPYFTNHALVGGGYEDVWFDVDGQGQRVPYSTDFIQQQTVSYLDAFERDDGQPWMLIASTPAPHHPWTPSADYVDLPVGTWAGTPSTRESDRSDKPPWVRSLRFSLAEARRVRTPQLRTLRSVDDLVGAVMTRLRDLAELPDTLVIYTSDNGYVWGDHRLGGDHGTAGQKRFPYTASVKVPFFLRWDGHVAAGTTDARLAGMVDVVPTVLDAAGLDPDYALDGHSLLSAYARGRILLEYWHDPGAPGIPAWISLRTRGFQFIEWYDPDGSVSFREYYDLMSDPWQLVNLLNDGDPTNPGIGPIVTQARRDATCVGTTDMSPAPANPCP